MNAESAMRLQQPTLVVVWSSANGVRAALAVFIDLVVTERAIVPAGMFEFESAVYESRHSSFCDGVVMLCSIQDPPADVARTVARLRRELLWEGGIVVAADCPRDVADTKLFANVDAPLRDAPGVIVCDATRLGAMAKALNAVGGCTREQWSDYANALSVRSSFDELHEAAQAALKNGVGVAPLITRMQAVLERIDWDIALQNHRAADAARALIRESVPRQEERLVALIERLRELAISLESWT